MKNLENLTKYKDYLLPALIFLGIVFASVFFLSPKIINLWQLQKQISQEKKQLSQLTEKLSFLEGLDKASLASKGELLLNILPTEKDVPLILATLKELTTAAKLDLTEVKVSPEELVTTETVPSLAFKIKIKGNSEDLTLFLENLIKTAPLMEPTKIVFKTNIEGLEEVDLDLLSFFQPLPESLGPVDSPLSYLDPRDEEVYQKVSGFQFIPKSDFSGVGVGKENPFGI